MPTPETLFEQQSYLDALEYYTDLLNHTRNTVAYDYVILTASNASQAAGYMEQINDRLSRGRLPDKTHYAVIPDRDGKRVGSGGATFGVLKYIYDREKTFKNLRILVIHSGGDSKRVPQYSACGKLFSPVPRVLPDGRRSTLFDEFMIGTSTVAGRINEGMLVCSGDVLLLFNALQIDFYSAGAAALSIKEDVQTGKNHGVYLNKDGMVGRFLHKQTVETLTEMGAVDNKNRVDIDTGAVILSSEILADLYSLVETEEKMDKFVNEKAKVSFYADFMYPLAIDSTLDKFYLEKPEGDYTEELKFCRTEIWNVLHKYSMKLIRLSPASFIHFGTTRELLKLMTKEMEQYSFLNWSATIGSNLTPANYAVSNSYISRNAFVDENSYIEDCYIHHDTRVGKGCVLSGVTLHGEQIPDNTAMHGLKLNDGKFTVRIYGVNDNPKENKLFGKEISEPLWTAKIYPVADTIEEAVTAAVKSILHGEKCENLPLTSMTESFNNADVTAIIPWQIKLTDKVKAEKILQAVDDFFPAESLEIEMNDRVVRHLINAANRLDENILEQFSRKIRIYYYLYKLTGKNEYADKCFDTVCDTVLNSALKGIAFDDSYKISKDEVITRLPVRVNWGGGWSDTPPYCMEHGGTVLNAAVSFDGELPIEVTLKRTSDNKITLASTDIGSEKTFDSMAELTDCKNPSDAFALHKAALIACGVIPADNIISVDKLCENLGGGIYINTRVINIPKGSGLGTSSILAGACVKGIFEFLGKEISDNELYDRVLCMEQLMSTGGGWQDQVGGLAKGIKMVTSPVGLKQSISCKPLTISDDTIAELNERFCLIYTGQRRLARNLLREVVGKYIGGNPQSINVLYEIQRTAVLMAFELEKGNVDGFGELLNRHWELSKQLDNGCTNTCIDQIFLSAEDLLSGKMICGAGGGGFLQVILKKGVTKEMLKERLHEVFADSGVDVWNCKFYY